MIASLIPSSTTKLAAEGDRVREPVDAGEPATEAVTRAAGELRAGHAAAGELRAGHAVEYIDVKDDVDGVVGRLLAHAVRNELIRNGG